MLGCLRTSGNLYSLTFQVYSMSDDNIQYPMSNVECPSGARVWCQQLHPALPRALGRSGVRRRAIVLTPNARPTWTFDIGHWILDILTALDRSGVRRQAIVLTPLARSSASPSPTHAGAMFNTVTYYSRRLCRQPQHRF